MEKQVIIIKAERQAYSIDQIYSTLTVGELIAELQNFDEDMPVVLSHDNGYTYGGITYDKIEDYTYDDEEEQDGESEC